MTLSTTRSVQRITRISELVSVTNDAQYNSLSTTNYADKRIGECINYARYSTANYADKRIGECN